MSFAPPPCRMPLGQSQDIPQTDPRGMATPRFWHRLIRFRHVISGSLALASLNHTCRNLVPTFPQRSPPSLLTIAACGGLRSTPDCRSRRAFLHLSYSYAPPCGPALLVTQYQSRYMSAAPSHGTMAVRCGLRCGLPTRRRRARPKRQTIVALSHRSSRRSILFPLLAVCHEYRRSIRRYATVREMKEDPSRSAIWC